MFYVFGILDGGLVQQHGFAAFVILIGHIFIGKKKVSPDKMAEMQARIDEERKALEAKLDMEEEERNKARAELEKREKDLLKAQ